MEIFRCRKRKMKRKGVEHEVTLQKRRALHYLDTGERLQNPKDTTDEEGSENRGAKVEAEESQSEEDASDQLEDGEGNDEKKEEENEEETKLD